MESVEEVDEGYEMKTGISEGFICPCGKKYHREVFPNEAVGVVSCPCGKELIHLFTHKIEIMDGSFRILAYAVFENPALVRIVNGIRNRIEREKRMEARKV